MRRKKKKNFLKKKKKKQTDENKNKKAAEENTFYTPFCIKEPRLFLILKIIMVRNSIAYYRRDENPVSMYGAPFLATIVTLVFIA